MLFTPKKLSLLISSLCWLSPYAQTAQAAESVTNVDGQVELLPTTVEGKHDKDAEGRNKVYAENVTNLYLGREELERYQNSNPADVFKGLNGVYSMDSRNGTALSPNIRGLSGEGRVPLTVDGTEQSTNVWLQVYGAGNRNYVDPALFRSISVEKGPSLTRGVKSGVGGAVSVRTIDADDIIADGDTFGFDLKLETSGSTVKPRVDANDYFGRDYRDIPGAVLGADKNVNIPQPVPRTRGHNDTLNFDDNAVMFAVAGRTDFSDLLVSYSERKKGNYFAGKQGAGAYSNNDAYARDSAAYFPNLTKLYKPGNEILSTSSDTSTLLAKNNWYLADNHKIGLSFMRTDLEFAETSPGQAVVMLGFAEELEKQAFRDQLVAEYPKSEIRLDTYKLSHEWKPEGSRWIDLQSNLWMTKTDGERHQTGSGAYYVKEYDTLLEDWKACKAGKPPVSTPDALWNCYIRPELNPFLNAPKPEPDPNVDARVFAGSAQWTSHDRTGFDFSNMIVLRDNLHLTMAGEFQREKLDERVTELDLSGGIGIGGSNFHYATANYGPRSGDRREYAGSMNLEWQALPWLTLTAGTRYNRYSAFDEGLADRRRNRVSGSKINQQKTGVQLDYGQLMTDAEAIRLKTLDAAAIQALSQVTPADSEKWANEKIATPAMAAHLAAQKAFLDFSGKGTHLANNGAYYWLRSVAVPLVDGKVDASQSPFANGSLDASAVVQDAQGNSGEYAVITPISSPRGSNIYALPAAGDEWAEPEKQSGHAWSPVFSATARVTEYGSLFGRYAQITRFPSIFEVASTSVGMDGGSLATRGATKPERSTNWEIGYAHDLTQFFPDLQLADARLSYFDTTIEDFIERDIYLNVIQFDEKKTTGIEFQSRFDSGRFFGGVGATYRLKQELCDKDYAYSFDVFKNRMPECMTGGFPDTLTASSLQPRYSVNTDLGTRLFNERLELGMRSVYHAKAENKDLDDLLNTDYGHDIWVQNSASPLYWKSVLLHDAYARVRVDKHLDMNMGITNLTDRYYMDPMSKIPVPGPGRTLTVGMRARF